MDEKRPDAHLRDVDDGCGCTEIWEHTSSARAEAAAEDDSEGATAAAGADEADETDEAGAADGD